MEMVDTFRMIYDTETIAKSHGINLFEMIE